MKTAIKIFLFPLRAAALLAQRPWQQITVRSVGDAAALNEEMTQFWRSLT
jgi:hypothetical protein